VEGDAVKELKQWQAVRILSTPRSETERFVGRVGVVTQPQFGGLAQVRFNRFEAMWCTPEMCELVEENARGRFG
jgi:hypothetical protein